MIGVMMRKAELNVTTEELVKLVLFVALAAAVIIVVMYIFKTYV